MTLRSLTLSPIVKVWCNGRESTRLHSVSGSAPPGKLSCILFSSLWPSMFHHWTRWFLECFSGCIFVILFCPPPPPIFLSFQFSWPLKLYALILGERDLENRTQCATFQRYLIIFCCHCEFYFYQVICFATPKKSYHCWFMLTFIHIYIIYFFS